MDRVEAALYVLRDCECLADLLKFGPVRKVVEADEEELNKVLMRILRACGRVTAEMEWLLIFTVACWALDDKTIGNASWGELIRDDGGRWVGRFMNQLGKCFFTVAKTWAVLDA
ncbi:hypothetical protein GH714_011858 [Hevea brasiliensis]|uniref:Uncharacterized protein n=1 Tax=Hevea brasiliensis TaxID=3981 RepID=A0A6A6MC30_HEVBR|nr:hypothetical protein GH714_011858 [Hevea brasiliensis]